MTPELKEIGIDFVVVLVSFAIIFGIFSTVILLATRVVKGFDDYKRALYKLFENGYDPIDFWEYNPISVRFAKKKYSRVLREKQRLENTNRDELNY